MAATGASTPVPIPGPPPAMSATTSNGNKRKYRRHPKTDPNEPQKPQSAYVVFANEVRAELRDMKLSFSELAKIVGERWKNMTPDEKRAREEAASRAKHEYHQALGMYRQSPAYVAYQAYLREFEAAAALAGRGGSVEAPSVGRARKSKMSASKQSGKKKQEDADEDDEIDQLEPEGARAETNEDEATSEDQNVRDTEQRGGGPPPATQPQPQQQHLEQGHSEPAVGQGGLAQQDQPFLTAPASLTSTNTSPLAATSLMLPTSILSDNVDATLALIPAPNLGDALTSSTTLPVPPQQALVSSASAADSPLSSVSLPAQPTGGDDSPNMDTNQQQPSITFSASPKDLTVSGQVTPTTSATTMAPVAVGVDAAGKSVGQLDGFM